MSRRPDNVTISKEDFKAFAELCEKINQQAKEQLLRLERTTPFPTCMNDDLVSFKKYQLN